MIDLTKFYYFVFGAFTILGGVMGYVKAKSVISIATGGVSGVLLIVAGILLASLKDKPHVGLGIGLVITIALLGKFLPDFIKKGAIMPAGVMTILGVISLIVTVLAIVKR